MDWYVTSLLSHKGPLLSGSAIYLVRVHHCLVTADGHDAAYEKSLELGRQISDTNDPSAELRTPQNGWHFYGLSDLLMVYEQPTDGSELFWSQEELTLEQQRRAVRHKERLRAFSRSEDLAERSGWYVASLVLAEVHDTGNHGQTVLTWINGYLLKADNTESAYDQAMRIGSTQVTDPGSHECDGDEAHWEFRGIHELVETIDPPVDRARLWFDEFEATADQLKARATKKSDLGVFAWEARRYERV